MTPEELEPAEAGLGAGEIDREAITKLWRISLALALLLVAHLGPSVCARAGPADLQEKRVALVIGNGAYANAPRLANPAADAQRLGCVFGDA